MPIYTYECEKCNEVFEEMRPISKADDKAYCPLCGGSDTKRKFNPGNSVSINYTGWDWGDKCRKFGAQRAQRSEDMKHIQKDYYGGSNFVTKTDE